MKKLLLIVAFAVLILGLGYYYISGLPQYTFYLIYKSIKNHDVESFYKYVDVESVIDNFMNDAFKALPKDQVKDEWGALGVGLALAMKPMAKTVFTDLAKQEITNAIENIEQPTKNVISEGETPIKSFADRFKSLKSFSNIKMRIQGKVAEAEISPTEKEEALVIKMRQTDRRFWKIVAIKVPFLEEIKSTPPQ